MDKITILFLCGVEAENVRNVSGAINKCFARRRDGCGQVTKDPLRLPSSAISTGQIYD